jgi:hypothetical protein
MSGLLRARIVGRRAIVKLTWRAHATALISAFLFVQICQFAARADDVQFSRDIRPILSDVCYQCHGPDKESREAELRLDERESVFAAREGKRLVVPGDLAKSELYRRITSTDKDERMPPAEARRKLTAAQVDLIRRWIEQGGQWQQHWSFVAPKRPTRPKIKAADWCRNELDYFVIDRLEREGLVPSVEASKETLIRRVTLDLTGLPPTPAEIDAFLADKSDDAYEKVVDRLLKSPRYGERMAFPWLDAARYADTSGYQNDGPRSMWRWRDWVIKAFNQNMPFDKFTIEQIAGDMLPGATLDQRIATAFNRNHRGNAEGGIIADEYQVEYVVDRVDTTATVWLGLTMGCARCHDHKYDPIAQKEFYQVFAYFNNIPEYGRAIKEGNSPPYIKAPTDEQQAQLARLDKKLATAEKKFDAQQRKLDRELAAWEKPLDRSRHVDWQPSRGLLAHYPFNHDVKEATGRAAKKAAKRRSKEKKKEIENENGSSGPRFVDGKPLFTVLGIGPTAPFASASAHFDGKRFIDAGDVAKFGYFDKFSISAWITLNDKRGGTIVSRMTDEHQADGWYLQVVNGHLQFNLVKRWLDDSIRVEAKTPLEARRFTHVMAVYDGSRTADAITLYIDGKPQPKTVHHDFLNQTFANDQPLRIGGGNGSGGRFRGLIEELRIYDDTVTADDAAILAVKEPINRIVATARENRTAQQADKLRRNFLENHASKRIRALLAELLKLQRERQSFVESLPTLMVMKEMQKPRETFVLTRGQYNKPADRVAPGVPSIFPPLPKEAKNNRLGFARWLVDRSNPLTARVTVNRFWQMLFGTGLVKTVEDFGTQGERPTHPALLDWLAVELMDNGWNVKQLLKTIVMSATYRQSSRITPALLARDPDNRLLARGPRMRLSAEMIRDQALAISGLLRERLGGPSVRPYQPAGLWKEIATDTDYQQSTGADLYRRSLYTYWKRTVAPPNMVALDASPREACIVRQTRTNTPLQALALMNDVTFVEASRVFAERIMTEAGEKRENRIHYAFRAATAREPSAAEVQILLRGLEHYIDAYGKDNDAALKLINTGESKRNEKLPVAELAAYTAICSLVLNLDETLTKE